MPQGTTINIKYPFQTSKKGYFVELNDTDNAAIKSDLLHLILTPKGRRFYMPNFGTNLLKFIFEPNDQLIWSDIESDIKSTVKLYLPSLTINRITAEQSEESEFAAKVTIDYTITDAVFETTEVITINI